MSIVERQKGLAGSWIAYQGPSRTGKTYEATIAAIQSAMLTGGICLMYDPVGDLSSYVVGYRRYYERAMDRTSGDTRLKVGRILDFLRTNVVIYRGRDAEGVFDHIADLIGDGMGHAIPQGSVLIDEGSVARTQPQFLETIAPLFGNSGILGFVTLQRIMAIPPQTRAVMRYRCLWYSADYTGEDCPKDFEFTPVMSDENLSDEQRTYRGLYYGAKGPEPRSYNPTIERKRPDWLLLPAPVSVPVERPLQ